MTEIVTGYGKLGVSAVPFALAGKCAFTTVKPRQHSLTAANIIGLFTGKSISIEHRADGTHLVKVA